MRQEFVQKNDKLDRTSNVYFRFPSFGTLSLVTHENHDNLGSNATFGLSWKRNARDPDQNPRASLPRRSQFWTRGALTSLQQPARPQRLKPLPTDRQSSWYVPHAPVCDDKNALLLTFVKPPAGKQKKKWSKGKGTQTPTSILRAHRIQP
jgi:hypothetical protein